MNYINHFNLFGLEARQRPTLVGNGSPTAQTVGSVGELYMDKLTGDIYKCVAVKSGVYTWALLVDDSSLNELRDEVTRYVDEQTEIMQADLSSLQTQLNEESHFRGYLTTNTKIQALEATPNDFAYSAESGTKWVYDIENGWQDTGTPVPDQLTPASDATPLVNGTASAGTANEYARGDHRHPTDTTRVSVVEFNAFKLELETSLDNIISKYGLDGVGV